MAKINENYLKLKSSYLFSEIARFGFGLPGQNHRGIGRHIAVRGLARRLDHDPRQVDAGRQPATDG